MSGSGWVGVKVSGSGGRLTNVRVGPGFGVGVLIEGSNGHEVTNLTVDSRVVGLAPAQKTGRNSPCPCGSGLKYKRCHIGGSEMSKGIVSINSSGSFVDTTVLVDAGGTGIYRVDDRTDFERTTVLVGQEIDVLALISALNLPIETPKEHIVEAISQVRESGSTDALQYSKLRIWLMDNNFDMRFWAETAVAIGIAALGV